MNTIPIVHSWGVSLRTKDPGKSQRAWVIFIMVVVLLLTAGPTLTGGVTGEWNMRGVHLVEGSHDAYLLDSHDGYLLYSSGSRGVVIQFSIIEGGSADLYIMRSNEYWNRYRQDWEFIPSFSGEGILLIRVEWTQPDDQDYYLVIDNRDTPGTGTSPQGNITYQFSLRYGLHEEDDIDDDFLMVMFGGCTVIIIVIIFGVWLIFYRKKESGFVPAFPGYPPMGPPGFGPPMAPPVYQPAMGSPAHIPPMSPTFFMPPVGPPGCQPPMAPPTMVPPMAPPGYPNFVGPPGHLPATGPPMHGPLQGSPSPQSWHETPHHRHPGVSSPSGTTGGPTALPSDPGPSRLPSDDAPSPMSPRNPKGSSWSGEEGEQGEERGGPRQ